MLAQWPDMPAEPRQFIDELLKGQIAPMGYIFFQEFTENETLSATAPCSTFSPLYASGGRKASLQSYEGAVLSYGRVNKENRRFRDRLDLILESPVNDGVSTGLSRLRIYVDPYNSLDKKPLWQGLIDNPAHPLTHQLFNQLAAISWAWSEDKNRIWQHWITDYIDYFGSRQWTMLKSYFHVAGNPHARISNVDDEPEINAA